MTERHRGLYMKYFVLKPAGTTPYAEASRLAMQRYIDAIVEHDPILASDLQSWLDQTFEEES